MDTNFGNTPPPPGKPTPAWRRYFQPLQRLWNWFARQARAMLDRKASRGHRLRAALGSMGAIGGICFLLLAAWTLLQIPLTPGISDLKKAKHEQPSVLVSVDGQRLASYTRFHREWVPLEKISPHVVTALVATEDHRFYQHHGIDFHRLAGAAARTLTGRIEGGSTITQQLARNLYPEEIGRTRSINRKIRETVTALKIEHAYTKREILETYLNTVPFLYNAYGIEMAARTYFDKPAAKLSLLESATLIGMLKGASYYNPVFNPQRALARRNVVLAQMVKRGKLPAASLATLQARPIQLDFERQLEARGAAPHFAEHIRKWLIEWADRHDYNIYADGLKVYTTIDSRLQAAANAAVKRQADALQAVADVEWSMPSERLLANTTAPYAGMQGRVRPFGYFWNARPELLDAFVRESGSYRNAVAGGADPAQTLARLKADAGFLDKLKSDKTRLETGLVAIDPTSGDVKAWVGSRDFDIDQYDHVARARRQPGSTFKPFVYGAALQAGIPQDKRYIDQVSDIRMEDGSIWRPQDITPPSGRPMSMREGLAQSKNTITAQVMRDIGPAKAADFARRAGVRSSQLDPVPALALGTSPVTLMEMASSYATIAAGGEYRPPIMVTRVEDSSGRVLVEFSNRAQRALPHDVSEQLVDMLRDAVDHGTGQAIRSQFGIRADVAGKTGTTQDYADGWFLLMHPRLVTGAWVGFNDARVTMRSAYWGQGSHTALPVVAEFFRQASGRRLFDAAAQFPQPRDSWFGASVWGPVVDWVEGFFGGGGTARPAREQQRRVAPAPSSQRRPDGDTPLDAVEDAVRQARDAGEAVRRDWNALQRTIDRVRRFFD